MKTQEIYLTYVNLCKKGNLTALDEFEAEHKSRINPAILVDYLRDGLETIGYRFFLDHLIDKFDIERKTKDKLKSLINHASNPKEWAALRKMLEETFNKLFSRNAFTVKGWAKPQLELF